MVAKDSAYGADQFRCEVMREDDGVRITLAGELDLDCTAAVESALRETPAAAGERRVLDLRALTFMDSSGLRLILSAHAAAQRDGWSLMLVPGPPAIQRVFELCGVKDELSFVAP